MLQVDPIEKSDPSENVSAYGKRPVYGRRLDRGSLFDFLQNEKHESLEHHQVARHVING